MTFGAVKAYDYGHATESEKLLLANVEALTSGESGGGDCYQTFEYGCNGESPMNYKCTNNVTADPCYSYVYNCCR